ncbi:MAG: hypothetical protein AB8F78_11585 [Saprospiraceae bacterium]
MRVQLSRKPFGDHILCTLGNADTHISFVPERSGYIHQIRVNGRDLLWNYATGPELTGNSAYRNLALLPFPNRLLEGEYQWNGRSQAFEVNSPESKSALHGFGPLVPFSIERYDLSEQKATVKLTYLHRESEHPVSYPFLVKFGLVLKVDIEAHSVTWQFGASNLGGASAPVGLGWHPYFLLPGGHEQWKVQLPPHEHVLLEDSIPTGKRTVGLGDQAPINTDWDDCFALTDPESLEVQLLGPDFSLSLKQLGSTRYTQMYVPDGNESLAIEPMTCGVDAFNVSKDEVDLAPGKSISTGMIISLL